MLKNEIEKIIELFNSDMSPVDGSKIPWEEYKKIFAQYIVSHIVTDVKIKAYCELCKSPQEVHSPLQLRKDKLNGDHSWSDVVCKKCGFVIATFSVDDVECDIVFVEKAEIKK